MGVWIVPTWFSKTENSRTNLISNKEGIEQLDFLYFLINKFGAYSLLLFFLSAAVSHLHWFVYKADFPTALPYTVPQVSITKLAESFYKEKCEHQSVLERKALFLTEAFLSYFHGCLML